MNIESSQQHNQSIKPHQVYPEIIQKIIKHKLRMLSKLFSVVAVAGALFSAAEAGMGGPCGSGLGETLMCNCRRGRNCGYLEYYKPGGSVDMNSPHYSSWRSDHKRGTYGGEWDEDEEQIPEALYDSRLPKEWRYAKPRQLAFANFQNDEDLW